MKVKDLIRKLEGFDSDLSVFVEYEYFDSDGGKIVNSYSDFDFRKEELDSVNDVVKLLIISKKKWF